MRVLTSQRLFRFVVVGGAAAALLFGLTYLFLRAGVPPFAGGLAAYLIAFVCAYLLQRNWTFEARSQHRRTLPRYFAVQALCAALSGVAAHLLVEELHVPPAGAAVVSTVIVSALSFVLSSVWVFRDQDDPR